eukprot:11518477-Prorocentrum_lima.AAC.1
MALRLGANLEPRMIMMMLTNITDRVIREDDILKRTWSDRAMHPRLRNPTSTWDIGVCEDKDWRGQGQGS